MSERNQIHSDVEQEGLYQNCKLVISGIGVLTPVRGQTWYIVFICKLLKNIFSNAIHINLKLNEIWNEHGAFYLNYNPPSHPLQ